MSATNFIWYNNGNIFRLWIMCVTLLCSSCSDRWSVHTDDRYRSLNKQECELQSRLKQTRPDMWCIFLNEKIVSASLKMIQLFNITVTESMLKYLSLTQIQVCFCSICIWVGFSLTGMNIWHGHWMHFCSFIILLMPLVLFHLGCVCAHIFEPKGFLEEDCCLLH